MVIYLMMVRPWLNSDIWGHLHFRGDVPHHLHHHCCPCCGPLGTEIRGFGRGLGHRNSWIHRKWSKSCWPYSSLSIFHWWVISSSFTFNFNLGRTIPKDFFRWVKTTNQFMSQDSRSHHAPGAGWFGWIAWEEQSWNFGWDIIWHYLYYIYM